MKLKSWFFITSHNLSFLVYRCGFSDGVWQTLPQISSVVRPPFSWSFDEGKRDFLSLFFWSVPVGVPGLETSAAPCPGYKRSNKEIEGTPCCLVGRVSQVPHVTRQPNFLFWSFRVFLHLLVVWYLGVFTCKGEELGGMTLIHLGETESSVHFSMKNTHLCHLNSTG